MGDDDAYEGGPTFIEILGPHLAVHSSITAIYHSHKSPFQLVQVLQAQPWGKCLVLDNHMQSSENDEFLYHESLVHPVMINHPNPRTVFVGGGGEGATVREILRYKSVERVVMVDIDGECVEVCQKFLPNHHKGSFKDSRLELVIDDAKVYLENTTEQFDVIFFDLSDPVEGGPAKLLYTKRFYEMCATRLKEGGILATQAGPAGILTANQVYSAIYKTISSVFPKVYPSAVFIPSFVDCWGFVAASKRTDFNPQAISKVEVDKSLAQLDTNSSGPLKFLDGLSYKSLFVLPKSTRTLLQTESRIITEDTPLVIP